MLRSGAAGTLVPMWIDLNADLGEGVTDDEGLLAVVTSANLACGFHAGDEVTMRAVCRSAARRGVVVGAQVSYRDREGFGRRPIEVDPDVLTAWVAEQVALLEGIARESGLEVAYVKPHGALYNRVVEDEEQAAAVLAGSGSLPVLGLPASAILRLAERAGRVAVPEGFPDRGYTDDGRLVPRDQPGALVAGAEEIAANAVGMARAGRCGRCASTATRRARSRPRPGSARTCGARGSRSAPGSRGVWQDQPMQARLLGEDALLLECGSQAAVQAAYAEALRRRDEGDLACRDIVPAATTVLLDGLPDRDDVRDGLGSWPDDPPGAGTGRLVELPVTYDGPDLATVASHWGIDPDQVAERHRALEFTVAFCGFAPGFAYLTGLPEELHVPRLEEPRAKVPAGSVGLAGEYTGIYPRPSPGGWLLVARTSTRLWDLDRDPPALLTPGTRVRFVDA